MTERSFAFAGKKGAPFFFASASDGTNVVQIFEEAIKAGMEFNEKPPQDFVSDVLSLLAEVGRCYVHHHCNTLSTSNDINIRIGETRNSDEEETCDKLEKGGVIV